MKTVILMGRLDSDLEVVMFQTMPSVFALGCETDIAPFVLICRKIQLRLPPKTLTSQSTRYRGSHKITGVAFLIFTFSDRAIAVDGNILDSRRNVLAKLTLLGRWITIRKRSDYMWTLCIPKKISSDVGRAAKNDRICIVIPLVIIPWRPPEPDRWITSNLLKESFVRDLQVLASIDELASRLSSRLKKQVQNMVRQSAKEETEFPPDFGLNFHR